MTVLASDNFDRANVNPLAGNWTTSNGEAAMQIAGNVATPSNLAADCGADYTGVTWPADQYSKAKLAVTGAVGGDQGALLKVRSVAGVRTYYRLVVDHAATLNVNLSRFVAGTPTTLTGWPVTQAWTDGDTWELRVIGTILQVFLNGVQVGPTTVDTNIGAGSAGIGYSSTVTAVSHNDWEGGDFSGGIPVTNPLIRRQFMKVNPHFNTAIPAAGSSSFRRTLHRFGAGKGNRRKGK